MKILELKPVADRGGGRMDHVATCDAQVTDEIAFYGMRLLRDPAGGCVSYAATAQGGRHAATFARPLAVSITAAALKTYLELDTAHDRSSSAA